MKLCEIVNPAGLKVAHKCNACKQVKMMRPGMSVCSKCKSKTKEAARLKKLAAVPNASFVAGGLPSQYTVQEFEELACLA